MSDKAKGHPSRVAVLLCTYNGQSYLAEQLDSFEKQEFTRWDMWASDDGSTDGTLAILEAYRNQWGADRLSIRSGPRNGFVANFLSLSCAQSIERDYYAYSDQDDVWMPDKLARAVAWLESVPRETPALYFSREYLADKEGHVTGVSKLFKRPPSFANALVQCICRGHTIVYNHAASLLLREAGPQIPVASHDWWVYLLVTGAGGEVLYDTHPTVCYRQHELNVLGSNGSLAARWRRFRMLFGGTMKNWSDLNIAALYRLRHRLTPDNLRRLDEFTAARKKPLFARLAGLLRSGVHRQSLGGTLAILVAAAFGRI